MEAAVIVTDNEKHPQAFPDASVGPPLPVENHRQICPYVQGGMEEQVWEPWWLFNWRSSGLELIDRRSHVELLKHNIMDCLSPWLFEDSLQILSSNHNSLK